MKEGKKEDEEGGREGRSGGKGGKFFFSLPPQGKEQHKSKKKNALQVVLMS